jgi:hypothetical protein
MKKRKEIRGRKKRRGKEKTENKGRKGEQK